MLFGKPNKSVVKHPGLFSAHAKEAGMSTPEYTQKVLSDPNASPKEKMRARLAQTFSKMRK